MGFNIDINQLNGEWKQWAETADSTKGDGNGFINSVMEVDDVITNALQNGKNAQEIASVIRGTSPEDTQSPVTPDKSRAKTLKKDVFAQLEKVSFNGDWDEVGANMTASMISKTQSVDARIYYSQLAIQVRSVVDAFNYFKCDSKEVIDKLEKNVTKFLKIDENDEFRDFKLDLIDEFVEKAKAHQKQVETQKVNDLFNGLRLEGKTREEALEEVKTKAESEFGFKGSYYKKIISDMDNEVVLDDAREEIWNAIEQQRTGKEGLKDSKAIENAVIEQLKKEGKYDKFTQKVLRGELSLGQKFKWERSQVKAFRKSVAADNRAAAAKAKHWSEDEIRGEFKKKHSAAFTGLISNEVTITTTDAKGKATQSRGTLITEKTDEEGNIYYDISNLSDLIRRRIGADLRANKQKGDLSAYSEIENIRQELSAACGVDISKKEAKHLIKLCGYDIESKNWAQVFYTAFANTIVDGVAAAAGLLGVNPAVTAIAKYVGPLAGTAFFDYSKEIPLTVDYENNQDWSLTINYGQGGGVNLTSLRRQLNLQTFADGTCLADYLNIETTDKGIVLTFKRDQGGSLTVIKKLNETFSKVVSLEELGIDPNQYDIDISNPKVDVGSVLVKTMLISFAFNLLAEALKENGEIPITATQFNETDIGQYLAKLSKEKKVSPSMFAGLRTLAMRFVDMKDGKPVEGGKWDSEGFKRVLNIIAGDQSFLNKYEAAIGTYQMKHKQQSEPDPEQKTEFKQEPDPVQVQDPETKSDPGLEVKRVVSKQELELITFTRWNDLVDGYSCLQKPEFNQTKMRSNATLSNRITKILQAISAKEGDDAKVIYNVRTIADFAKEADQIGTKNVAKLKELANSEKYTALKIDIDKYLALMNSKIGMVGGVLAPPLYDPQDEKDGNDGFYTHDGHKGDPLKENERGGTGDGVQVQKRVFNGKPQYYQRLAGTKDWQPSDEATYNNPRNKKVD